MLAFGILPPMTTLNDRRMAVPRIVAWAQENALEMRASNHNNTALVLSRMAAIEWSFSRFNGGDLVDRRGTATAIPDAGDCYLPHHIGDLHFEEGLRVPHIPIYIDASGEDGCILQVRHRCTVAAGLFSSQSYGALFADRESLPKIIPIPWKSSLHVYPEPSMRVYTPALHD